MTEGPRPHRIATPRRGRLALRIYLYTVSCAGLAIAILVGVALWMRPDFEAMRERWHEEHARPPDRGPAPPGAPPGPGFHPAPHGPRPGPPPMMPVPVLVVTGVVLLGAAVVGSYFFARSLVRPLARLEATALAFGKGDRAARTGIERADEIGAVARAFDDMAEETTALWRAERELMANVSHELRTPLARMRVALDLAAEGDADTAREVTGEIDRDVTELEALVDSVLASMRLDLAATPLRREAIAPGDLARRAVERARGPAAERSIRVSAPSGLRAIDVDPVLVRRVLDNLIDNARKYSEPASPIDVRVSQTAAATVFEVEDRGIGIAAADLERIFTPFFRADPSRQRGTGGVGLGLSLAHKIVVAHGGRITARSTPGAGSVFRVELPAGPPATHDL